MSFFELGTPRDTAWADWRSRKDQAETDELLRSIGAKQCVCGRWFRPRGCAAPQKFCSNRCREREKKRRQRREYNEISATYGFTKDGRSCRALR